VAGELYIGGAGLAWGYHQRGELTAERFVPNPFAGDQRSAAGGRAGDAGSRLYKTGDRVAYLADAAGNIAFLGRLDDQVKLRGYRVEPGEVAVVLGQHPQVRAAVVLAREDVPGDKRLVAYVVEESGVREQGPGEPAPHQESGISGQSSGSEDTEIRRHGDTETPHVILSAPRAPSPDPRTLIPDLRAFLAARLPEYMVPAAFVFLDALPLTPHGKIDRHALPAPDRERPLLEEGFVAPRTATEQLLAHIWAAVLRLDQVGLHDNFFALGGDSILSLQIIARAKQAGLQLSPRQLFQHQTIATLAAVAGTSLSSPAEQGLVTGTVPLSPIQHAFFAQQLPQPQHYNQAVLLALPDPLDAALLQQALLRVQAHHDALRLRFTPSASGWQQAHTPELDAALLRIDLTALAQAAQPAVLEASAAALQASLDLRQGPLLRAALFQCSRVPAQRLLLIIHHLLVDTVSWGILLEDLQTALRQLRQGTAVLLPPKTSSFQSWSEHLVAYAQSQALRQELPYWLDAARVPVARLPRDYLGGANTVASVCEVLVTLNPQATRALLQAVPPVYQTQINDVLLAALVQAWERWTGQQTLLLDLEGHGREELFEDVDVTRTVGWFTTLFPLRLDLRRVSAAGAALKAIKEQLRAIPQRGLGYGVLRYLSADSTVAKQLAELPAPEISFNYLGQLDAVIAETGLFEPAPEASGPVQDLRGSRKYLLDIIGFVSAGQLHMRWVYSEAVHERATIERLAQGYIVALQTLIAHCQAPDAGSYTPSDFPKAKVSQKELDKLIASINKGGRRQS
jgi:non-ribosomal peptide synthase protein (TIGR01720 family)